MPLAQPQNSPSNERASALRSTAPHLAYRIGELTFGLFGEGAMHLAVEPTLRDFLVEADSCDVRIAVEWAGQLEVPSVKPSFHSGGLWSVYGVPGGLQFCFTTPILGPTPYKSASFDSEFTRGRVALDQRYFHVNGPVFPMEYPLDELLMIHRLARGEGVEVHAVGVVDDSGCGHLFLGHSGAGKSTTARLWDGLPGARILSDDRIILRLLNGQIWMYGTPWHGDAGVASPGCAPLSRMYLLEHAGSNELIPLPKPQAAAELFARSFVPYHSAAGLEFTLSFVDSVAQRVPCSVFRFVPDFSAVEAICRADA
jgi:hypothetical protein